MSSENDGHYDDCSFVSIHYIICECGETFPTENGLKAHLEKEHPHKRERKEFKCGVCGSVFNTEEECIGHYEETHIEELKQEEYAETEDIKPHDVKRELSETELSQAELSQAELSQEELSHSEVYVQEPEGEFHKMEYVLPGQYKENSQDSQLELPQGQDVIFEGADEEYNDTENEESILPEQYVEVVQQIPEGQLVLVVKNAPKKKDNTNAPKKKNSNKKYPRNIVCEWCGKKYPSNAALRYHQRVHTGERPYHCHLCPKTFTMPLFLQIHIRVHTGERPFKCTDCPKAFSNKAALLRHERVHTGVKPYICPMCYKGFTQSNSMKLHVATVHLKQPAPYKSKSRKLKDAERMAGKDKPVMVKGNNNKMIRVVTAGKDGKSTQNPASIRPFAKRTNVRDVVVRRCDVIGRIDNPDENQRAIASLKAANGGEEDYKLTLIKVEAPIDVDEMDEGNEANEMDEVNEANEVVESEVVDDHSDQERYEIVFGT